MYFLHTEAYGFEPTCYPSDIEARAAARSLKRWLAYRDEEIELRFIKLDDLLERTTSYGVVTT